MRNFKGLLKIAGLEKKADPPNAGLNDPNPIKRDMYREYGYLPNSLFSPSQKNKALEVLETARKHPTASKGALFDLAQSMNIIPTSYITEPFKNPYISISGYPTSNELALRHELGHHQDYRKLGRATFLDKFRNDLLNTEIRAWDLAGVPTGNPIREAALDTYRALTSDSVTDEEFRGIVDNTNDTLSKFYQRPEKYIHKYKDSGIPIIYDYHSATNAVNRGYVGRFFPMIIPAPYWRRSYIPKPDPRYISKPVPAPSMSESLRQFGDRVRTIFKDTGSVSN